MQRLLNVSYGYLKFTFLSMLVATLLFAAASLGISSPRAFSLVAILGFAVFLLARSELQISRRHKELRGKLQTPELAQESLTQVLAFTQATSLLVYGLGNTAPGEARTLFVTEWIFKHDPSKVGKEQTSPVDGGIVANDEVALASKALERHRKELIRRGFSPLFLSKQRAHDIVNSFHERLPRRKGAFIHSFPDNFNDPHIVSIGFIQHETAVEDDSLVIEQILRDSFTPIITSVPKTSPDLTS